jgi:hypothetical protein
LNFPAFELLCLFSCVSFFLWNNKQAKKFGDWKVGGIFPSFILAHTTTLWFFLQQQLKCGLLFLCWQLLDLICRVVGFSFFSFRVRSFGSHLYQIRANLGNVDTSTRSCACLDAAALIRSWRTWRRRKRRGQTNRDREAKRVDRELLGCTPPARSRGIRKQFLRGNSAEICGAATAKKLIKFSSNWDLAHRLHQQNHRYHPRYQLLRLTLGK